MLKVVLSGHLKIYLRINECVKFVKYTKFHKTFIKICSITAVVMNFQIPMGDDMCSSQFKCAGNVLCICKSLTASQIKI